MTRYVFILLFASAGCDQAAPESNLVTSERALTEEMEVAAVELGDEVPLHAQETADPTPRATPPPVALDLEEVLAELAARPEGAAALASVGRRSAQGPRQAVEPTPHDEVMCQTGAHRREHGEPDADSVLALASDTAIRDRSSVPVLTRFASLPSHDLAGHQEAVPGPEVPTPLTY